MAGIKPTTILVSGAGRSGTSFVAEILHRHFKIYMGDFFFRDDEYNPHGYWEDIMLVDLSKYYLKGRLSYYVAITLAGRLIAHRRSQGRAVWGWKDPRLVYTLPLFLPLLKNPVIIWCERSLEGILSSPFWTGKQVPWTEFSEHEKSFNLPESTSHWIANSIHTMNFYKQTLNVPQLSIDFNMRRTEEEVIGEIQSFLELVGIDTEYQMDYPPWDSWIVGGYEYDLVDLTIRCAGKKLKDLDKEA